MEHTGNKTENTKATALITAVHRERYEILVEQETPDTKLNARLKTGVYYQDKGGEAFPTVGDRVRIQTNRCGDALILETLPRTSVFTGKIRRPAWSARRWRQTLTMCFWSCR